MGDILDIIKSRRTIKNFLPKYVDWNKVSKILDAARHAPSSGNIQDWRFIVILEPSLKHAVAKACYEQYEIAQAGVLIVVVSDTEKVERYYGMRGERLYAIQNCAAAIENMLLEAHSLGLGTRWIGGFDEEELRTLLRMQAHIRPQAVIAVGYPKDIPDKPQKFPLESVVYFNAWRNRHRDPAKYMQDVAVVLQRKAQATSESLGKLKDAIVDKAKEKFSKKETDDNEER